MRLIILVSIVIVVYGQHIPEHPIECETYLTYEACHHNHKSRPCAWCNLTGDCIFLCDKKARQTCDGGVEIFGHDNCKTNPTFMIVGGVVGGLMALIMVVILGLVAYLNLRRWWQPRSGYGNIN